MKNQMKLLKTMMYSFIIVGCMSCSSNDNENVISIEVPTVNYLSTNVSALFFEAGNTSAPTVNWNGDQGTFSLANTSSGISIENTTGIISWDRSLPLGPNEIEVFATNSAGTTNTKITIENVFQGTFRGGFNNDPDSTTIEEEYKNFYTYTFDSSGELISSSSAGTEKGTWTWSNDHQLLWTQTNEYIESFEVYNTGINAYIEGFWAQLPYNDGDPADGYIKLDIVVE